jgi:hypothetical protein
MNWVKNNVTLLILIGAMLVLNAFGVWLLLGAIDDEAKARTQYDLNLQERARLTTAPPGKRETPWIYPSPENRGLLAENEKLLREIAASMTEQLKENSKDYPTIKPIDFQILASNTVRRLIEESKKSATKVPDNFNFGFHYYVNGMFPFEANTRRLQQHLDTVETISRIIFESRVPFWEELLLVEPPGEAALKQNPALGIQPPTTPEVLTNMSIVRRSETGFLYDMIPYSIRVQCPPETLRVLLNRLASDPHFFIVTRIEPLLSVRSEDYVDVPPTTALPPTNFVYGEQQIRAQIIFYLRGVPSITDAQPAPDANQPNP